MVKKIQFLAVILLLTLFPAGLSAQCYELLWSDEFEYTGFPDPAYWTFETGGGGWGNNELQYYKANDPDNSWVADGKLTITAINESFGGRNYTSARLITRDKFSFQYGKIEARMKLPYSKGLWAAFWAMGQNIGEVGWPDCGEIDIMEFIGGGNNDKQIHSTLHWDNNGHQSYGQGYTLPTGIFADTFHIITTEWTPTTIRTYVDGIQFYVIDIRASFLSEFHQDFFILLNLAVGGNWPGAPDGTSVFPNTFEIDYVRVYKTTTEISDIPIEGENSLAQKAANKQFSLPFVDGWTYSWSVPGDAEILTGQGTENITVNWGCNAGQVNCSVVGSCETYEFSKDILLENVIHGPMFIGENEENVLLYIDSLTESSFQWTVPTDATIVSGQGTDSIIVNWGSSFDNLQLEITNSCGTYATSYQAVKKGQYPYPDINQPHLIPGVIEAVDFDYGGEGVSYHDSSPGNTGPGVRQDTDVDTESNDNGSPNVGWTVAGEWLEYTVKVETDSFYVINMRVATDNASGGPFSILFNDEVRLSGISVANTGGWDAFITKKLGIVYLTEEDTVMRVQFNSGGFNIGKITITPTTDPTGIEKLLSDKKVEIYPVPATETLNIQGEIQITRVSLMDMKGRYIKDIKGLQDTKYVLDIRNYTKGIYILRIETRDGTVSYKKIIINQVNK